MGHVRAILKIINLIIWIFIFTIIIAFARIVSRTLYKKILMKAYIGIIAILGVRVQCYGEIESSRPVLFTSNHSSWLDILILASVLPASFVSKSEVRKWPVIGWLSALCNTVFVERKISKTKENVALLADRLSKGDCLIFFPEGTTTDGSHILPFKTGFFNVAQHESMQSLGLRIAPLVIKYSKFNNKPVTSKDRPHIAWYGDMDLAPHLWYFLQQRSLDVEVHFLPSVLAKDYDSRRDLAQYCYESVLEFFQK